MNDRTPGAPDWGALVAEAATLSPLFREPEPEHSKAPDAAPQRCEGPCPPQQVCDACCGPTGPDVVPERDEEAVAATPAAAPPRPEQPPRAPIAAGTYAVYEDGSGGVVLVLATSDGDTHHKHIPAKIIKMGEMMMGGNNPLSMLFGGR